MFVLSRVIPMIKSILKKNNEGSQKSEVMCDSNLVVVRTLWPPECSQDISHLEHRAHKSPLLCPSSTVQSCMPKVLLLSSVLSPVTL